MRPDGYKTVRGALQSLSGTCDRMAQRMVKPISTARIINDVEMIQTDAGLVDGARCL